MKNLKLLDKNISLKYKKGGKVYLRKNFFEIRKNEEIICDINTKFFS